MKILKNLFLVANFIALTARFRASPAKSNISAGFAVPVCSGELQMTSSCDSSHDNKHLIKNKLEGKQ